MRQATGALEIATTRQGLVEITDRIAGWVSGQDMDEGLLTVFCRHTSASLLIQENAGARGAHRHRSLFRPHRTRRRAAYAHDDEGPDDMPAHLRTALTQVSLVDPADRRAAGAGDMAGHLPVRASAAAARRTVALHLMGA